MIHHVFLLIKLGYTLFVTNETYPFFQAKNIPCTLINYADSDELPNIKSMISNKEIDLVINLVSFHGNEKANNYTTRRTAVDFGVPLLTNPQLFKIFVEALQMNQEGKIQFLKVSNFFD